MFKMSSKNVCRLCLVMDSPVHIITEGPLHRCYEKLTNVSLNPPHQSVTACYFCYSQLKKSHNLMVRSVRAHKVLTQIMESGQVVNKESISMMNYKTYQLHDVLTVTPVELISFTGAYDDSMETDIKEEPPSADVKEEYRSTMAERIKFEESDDEDMEGVAVNDRHDIESQEMEPEKQEIHEKSENEENMEEAAIDDRQSSESHVLRDKIEIIDELSDNEDMEGAAQNDRHSNESQELRDEIEIIQEELDSGKDIEEDAMDDRHTTESQDDVREITHEESVNGEEKEVIALNDKCQTESQELRDKNQITHESGDIEDMEGVAPDEMTVRHGAELQELGDEMHKKPEKAENVKNQRSQDDFSMKKCEQTLAEQTQDRTTLTPINNIVSHKSITRRIVTENTPSRRVCTYTLRSRKTAEKIQVSSNTSACTDVTLINKYKQTLRSKNEMTEAKNEITQVRTTPAPVEKKILRRLTKRITVLEKNAVNRITGSNIMQSTIKSANRQVIKNEFPCSDTTINERNVFVKTDNEWSSTNIDIDNGSSQHLKKILISNDYDKAFDEKYHLNKRIENRDIVKKNRKGSEHKQKFGRTKTNLKTSGQKSFQCNICEERLTSQHFLKIHKIKHKGEEKPLECETCHKRFNNKSIFQIHLRTHIEKPYECAICQNRFTSRGSLIQHIKIHTGDKRYKCEVCHKRFIVNSALKIHLRTHTGEKPYECSFCQQKFSRSHLLQYHKRTHREEKLFECNICNEKFNFKPLLIIHSRKHTGESFVCDICEMKFISRGNLIRHLRHHTGEKTFTCEVCGAKFYQKAHLKGHLRLHTGEKPYECDICNKRFSEKCNLKLHLTTHSTEKRFKCDICNSRYKNKNLLRCHLEKHAVEKRFECTICRKRFKMKLVLKNHFRTHTGEQPFECKVCQRKFSQKVSLNRHMKIHTGEKPYECETCQRRFIQKGCLISHLKSHSKAKSVKRTKRILK